MRRTKPPIYTHIYAPHLRYGELQDAISHAEIWSDTVFVTCAPNSLLINTSTEDDDDTPLFTIADTDLSRGNANQALFHRNSIVVDYEAKTINIRRNVSASELAAALTRDPKLDLTPVCVVLEPTWLISDPHVVRDTIELNYGATIFAKRYMMVNDAQYRNDSIYVPIPVVAAYPMRASGRFSSEANAAPDYAWTSQLKYNAPFDVLDFQFVDSDTSGGSIRSYEGMVPFMKDHS